MDTESNMDDIKGRAKEAVGDLTDNPDLKQEGKADRLAGKVKSTIGDAKDWIDDKVDAIKHKAT